MARYVVTAPMLGSADPDRMTSDDLINFAYECWNTFGEDPFKLKVDYDPSTLTNRLVAVEVED
jgi:hypothetical protein